MAGLIIGLAVMAILMTAVMPVWKQTVQREKEEELVFRGEQYAHAIGLFQRKSANSYPPNLDVLVQQKFLRKKYKDPVTNDDFVPLSQAAQAAAAQRGGQPGQTQQGQAQQGQPQQGQGQTGAVTPGAGPQGAPAGGVIGVTSKSADTSIRLYKGRSHYNEWAFIYTPPAQAPGGAGGSGAPGAGGRGQGGGQPGQNPQQQPPGGGGFGARGGGRGGPFQPGGPNGPGRGNGPTGQPQTPFNPFPGTGRGR